MIYSKEIAINITKHIDTETMGLGGLIATY